MHTNIIDFQTNIFVFSSVFREFDVINECFQPLMNRCPAIQTVHSDWKAIIDLLHCHCYPNKTSGESYYPINIVCSLQEIPALHWERGFLGVNTL